MTPLDSPTVARTPTDLRVKEVGTHFLATENGKTAMGKTPAAAISTLRSAASR